MVKYKKPFLEKKGKTCRNCQTKQMMMKSFTRKDALRLSAVFFLWIGAATINIFSQQVYTRPTNPSPSPKPYLQDIQVVQSNSNSPNPSSTPALVTKTASVSPAYPVLNDVAIPGYSGILVETLDGTIIVDSYSDYAFNPASNVKIATSYAVLKTFGPEFRFQTSVWTDGQIDTATQTLNGNLYVSGRDPMFNLEHGIHLSHELNRLGIQNVNGDLIVTDNFSMNYSMSPVASANNLANTMNAGKRTAASVRAWQNYLNNSGKAGKYNYIPSVTLAGGVYVQPLPSNLRQLFVHESAPLKEIVKVMMSYSNNFLSERLGDMVGGPYRVAQIVQKEAGIFPQEFVIQTASGLGINRVTPRAMMKLLRTFRNDLARWKMSLADVMPVAGIDKGTLEGRFGTDFSRGSVIGKTGTLGNTDGGVSSLAGEMNTRNGKLLFVIFNQRGSVARFRAFQNEYVSLIQGLFGGAVPVQYNQTPFELRLADTRIIYPDSRARIN